MLVVVGATGGDWGTGAETGGRGIIERRRSQRLKKF